jgi:hypothetical protein
MRVTLALIFVGLISGQVLVSSCSNSESEGVEAAKREAAAESKAKAKGDSAAPAKVMATPVPGSAHVPCTQLIDLAAFQTALAEKDPPTLKDITKSDANAAAVCAIARGGKRPSEAEQKAMLKVKPRLGVLAGDDLCIVSAYCWSIEDAERFKASCKTDKGKDDDTMGSYACVHVFGVGSDDVKGFKFFDEDTHCILQVRGGPSNVSNDSILSCAKTARDTIGPAQIKVDSVAAPAATGSAG